jgi:fatty acid desaturase
MSASIPYASAPEGAATTNVPDPRSAPACDQQSGAPRRRAGIFRSHRFPSHIEQQLRAMGGANTWRGILAVVEDWLLILIAAAAVIWGVRHGPCGYVLLIPSWIVIGARMRGLATLMHEAAHKVLAGPRWLNCTLGTICSSWWVVQSLTRYTQTHVREHHPNLNRPSLDPDARQYLRQDILWQDPNTVVIRHFLGAVSGAKVLVNLPYLLRDRLLPQPGAKPTIAELLEIAGICTTWATLIAALFAANLFGWFVLIWLVPYLTTYQAINWLIELSEHFPLQWTRCDTFQKTRNRKGPWWERFLFSAHGEGWHRAHHERPYIPFFALRRAHALMMQDPGYRAFEAESGGLLVRGPTGAPPILLAIAIETRRFQSERGEMAP